MKPFGLFALAALLAMSASGWTGFGSAKGCGPSLQIQDPQLRSQFAALDRQRMAEAAEICVLYRQAVQ